MGMYLAIVIFNYEKKIFPQLLERKKIIVCTKFFAIFLKNFAKIKYISIVFTYIFYCIDKIKLFDFLYYLSYNYVMQL